VDDNMSDLRHTQSSMSAGKHDQRERWGQCNLRYPPTVKQNRVGDTNGGTYTYTEISKTGTSSIGNYCGYWNKLRGDVPKLVPAEMKTDRNIGVWRCQRDVRLLVHAQSDMSMSRNIGVRRMHTDTDARVPLKPWHQVQGGVVKPDGPLDRCGLGHGLKHGLKVKRGVREVSCYQKQLLFIGK